MSKVFKVSRNFTIRGAKLIHADSAEKAIAIATAEDRDRIIQVLINFLSNAIKFSPPGENIWIKAEEVEEQIQFSVTDHGRGVPKEMQESVFDRFKQVETADAKKLGGTGLGLAICKAIVERHGGTIGLESEAGKGSRFWFRLPLETTKIESEYVRGASSA